MGRVKFECADSKNPIVFHFYSPDEVISLEAEGMVRETERPAKFHPNIVIKIPTTPEGLKAVKC